MAKKKHLFLPELVEPEPGPWDVTEVQIKDSAVNLRDRKAWVPKVYTPAQRLARMHELGHVKYTPRDWMAVVREVMAIDVGLPEDEGLDPNVVLRISKMLEENRIDWLLWSRHSIDLRPAREVLDWVKMPPPKDPLHALCIVLQLAWTVWASRKLSPSIPNPPPPRDPDPQTGEYFDEAWAMLVNDMPEAARAMVKGCMQMYLEPTHAMRNRATAELASFWPVKPEKDELPPEKPEEKRAQEEAEEEEERHEQYIQEQETGVGGEAHTVGHVQIHDHTATIRRPSIRLVRRDTPTDQGIRLRFPHRYMIDRQVFAVRSLTEAGIMIDGSGSMRWTNDDMKAVMDKVPAVMIGIYGGFTDWNLPEKERLQVYGRICILAKQGRFSRFDKMEEGFTGANDADFEGLQFLAKWPKPRFWLSDGIVNGGLRSRGVGPHPTINGNLTYRVTKNSVFYHPWEAYGKLVYECDRLIARHEIYRVPNVETLMKMLNRQRVTLYRSCAPGWDEIYKMQGIPAREALYIPDEYRPSPVSFCL